MAKPLFLHKEELGLSCVVRYRYLLNSIADCGQLCQTKRRPSMTAMIVHMPCGPAAKSLFWVGLARGVEPSAHRLAPSSKQCKQLL